MCEVDKISQSPIGKMMVITKDEIIQGIRTRDSQTRETKSQGIEIPDKIDQIVQMIVPIGNKMTNNHHPGKRIIIESHSGRTTIGQTRVIIGNKMTSTQSHGKNGAIVTQVHEITGITRADPKIENLNGKEINLKTEQDMTKVLEELPQAVAIELQIEMQIDALCVVSTAIGKGTVVKKPRSQIATLQM